MPLQDRLEADARRILESTEQFATEHLWDRRPIICVVDNHTALKRKNNNVIDISWDNDSEEILLYVHESQFKGMSRPRSQQTVLFDKTIMTVSQVSLDEGVYEMILTTRKARDVT